ncbi:MAG: hypothetical protein H6Q99_1570 [Proteobacteria bacterium]|nr:hypothetical protein [Pseudomonadota bacterium]
MLHENPLMADIDVDHWRNLQSLLLESAKEKRRIIVIHEGGKILKFAHSAKAAVVRPIDKVTDVHKDAEAIYDANVATTDLVVVIERGASDAYFKAVQNAWTPADDIDVYVHRAFTLMGQYPDGIVVFPGPASYRLGLQWRLGASYAEVEAAVHAFAKPNSSAVFGVFEGAKLWTTLVLHFDAARKIDVVTTVDPTEIKADGGREAVVAEVTEWVSKRYGTVSLGLYSDTAGAERFLKAVDKVKALAELRRTDALIATPLPAPLAALIKLA